jgi:hypothetical protein
MKTKELYALLNLSITSIAELPKGVYIPNEIFSDLVECDELVEGKTKQTSARAVAYTYTYICHWLYRYCKWVSDDRKVTQADLKQVLGYSRDNKTIDYIIKKNGVIENLGYLTTTNDYPVSYFFEDDCIDFNTIKEQKQLCNEEVKKYLNNDKNYKIKCPVKAFHRTTKSIENKILDGTFYGVESTHQVPFQVFVYCMTNEDIGILGFYLYSFLKHRNDIFRQGVDISHHKLSKETGVLLTKVDECLKLMKSHNMINVDVKDFVFNMPIHLRRANKYRVKDFELFGAGKGVVNTRRIYGYVEEQEDERGSAAVEAFADHLIAAAGDVPF